MKPFRRIAGELREQILSGELADGDRLPSQQELMNRYGVAKSTTERAIAVLRAEGLVSTRQGSGSFVRRIKRIRRDSPGRLSRERRDKGLSIQNHDDADGQPRSVDVVVGDVVPPAEVASALGVERDVTVLSRARRFVVGGRFVQFATSYLPTELTRGTPMEHTNTGPGGVYARLAECGLGPTRFTERVLVRAADPDDVDRLDLELDGRVVVEITRYAFSGDRCVEVTVMMLDPASYELIYSFTA